MHNMFLDKNQVQAFYICVMKHIFNLNSMFIKKKVSRQNKQMCHSLNNVIHIFFIKFFLVLLFQ